MKEKEKIVAVIVTYNRLEKLKKTISSALAQDFDELIVVNNNSTDSTQEWLESQRANDSRLTILKLDENTGGAGGFYSGTKFATENTDADWLVLFDDDAYAAKDLIDNFRSLDIPKSAGAASTAVYTPDGKIADFNRPGRNPFRSLKSSVQYLLNRESSYLSYDELKTASGVHVDVSSFVGFFVKTSVIKEKLGYPQKEFFIYCDDWSYSYEVSKLGYQNLYYSELAFYHDSNTFIDSYDKQIWKKYYAYRNAIHFYQKTAGLAFPLIFVMKLAKWLLDTRLYDDKTKYLSTTFNAIIDGLNFVVSKEYYSSAANRTKEKELVLH